MSIMGWGVRKEDGGGGWGWECGTVVDEYWGGEREPF